MRIDTNVLGAVHMADAGINGTPTTSRRYDRWDFARALETQVEMAKVADEVGFDTFWYTEHHFQYEGYEVVPNQILLGLYSAAVTERINFGQMFNIVPQWNPLRLAEDFAAADILTKGRMRFGVGRGTVPREMQSLGAQIEGTDNAMSVDAEARNREAFEEAMAVIKLAWTEESFSFSGKHFVLPPPGIPDRNTTVTDLTLVPTVLRDVEVYQACTSPRTVEYVAEQGHIGVYQRIPIKDLRAKMQHQVEVAQRCGRNVEIGDEQMLVVGAVVADTRKEAVALARPHHDEMVKLLAPYGRFSNYEPPAGMDSVPVTYAPTLEESMRQRFYAVGTSEDVADVIAGLRDELSLKRISVSLDGLDLTNDQMAEQYRRFGAEVAPLLGEKMVPETQAFPSGSDHGE